MRPWDIIQELESDNSRLKKEAIIKRESDADNIEFFNGVGAALDGFRTFGVQKVPVAKADDTFGLLPSSLSLFSYSDYWR